MSGEPRLSGRSLQPLIGPELLEKETVPVGVPAPGAMGATAAV